MYFDDLEKFEDWEDHLSTIESILGQLSPKVAKAIKIIKAEHDEPRIFTEGNYNRHPLRVARVLVEELKIFDEKSILIALCHDLGEWTNYDITELKDEFGIDVYEGVSTLTWDQIGEWSDFVDNIVNSNINNLTAIKIADKLDNNRAIALSGNNEEKLKAKAKTLDIIMPLVKKHHPEMTSSYDEVLQRLT